MRVATLGLDLAKNVFQVHGVTASGEVAVNRTRAEARQDVFDYIEMFYNPKRKHVRNGMPSPVAFERQHRTQAEGV